MIRPGSLDSNIDSEGVPQIPIMIQWGVFWFQ